MLQAFLVCFLYHLARKLLCSFIRYRLTNQTGNTSTTAAITACTQYGDAVELYLHVQLL